MQLLKPISELDIYVVCNRKKEPFKDTNYINNFPFKFSVLDRIKNIGPKVISK